MKSRISAVVLAVLLAACSKTPQQKEAKFLESGKIHLQKRDYQSAILDFKNALQAMPKDAEPHFQLGMAELESGHGQIAVEEFRRALQADPKHVGAQLKLSEMMAANRNPEVVKQGEKMAQAVLAAEPGNADALQALATAELRLGEDSADAIAHLQEALDKVPQHLSSATTLAMVKLRKNDVAGAEQVLLKSAAEAPKSPEHAVVLARFYLLTQKPDKAEAQFRRALSIDSAYGPALVGLGNLLFKTGRIDEAGKTFEKASHLKEYRSLHATFLLATGKNDAAIAEFEKNYNADKGDRDARDHLLSAYVKLQRTAEAEKILSAAIDRNAEDAEARLQRGYLLLNDGKFQEAQSDLTQALRYQADSPAAHVAMSRLHELRGESDQQIQELTEALHLRPGFLAARLQLAHVLTTQRSAKTALEILDQAPERDKQTVSFIAERNNALYALEDYAGMRKSLDKALAVSRDPMLLLEDGLLRMKLKDVAGSRNSFLEVLKNQPQEWRAVDGLAMGYQAEKKPAEVQRVVREYTSRAPNSVPAQDLLGSWLFRTGDPAGARAAFQAAEKIRPDSVAELGLAALDFNAAKYDDARNEMLATLKREPHNIKALLQIAQIEDRAGRRTEAISYYEKALQENSKNPPALNNLAYLLADTGKDPDRALELAQQVKALLPDSPTVDDTIGWAYYKKGLFHPALDYLKKASASNSPVRMCHLAMTYYQLGDRHQAYTLLLAAMKADPSLPEAKEAMALLGTAR